MSISSSSEYESQVTIKHKFSLKLSVKQKYQASYVNLPWGSYSPMKTETVSIDEGLHHPSFNLIHSTR